ncbi:hypothetical protein SERLA73DRAFT_187624 [Serpula lacrymans var. lacrymans S7.3]|uniref:Uncharacterized protein n=2 Tax=Serpula lacrymans var. lacrymans TaxID=341189 RepID=F8Q9R9_SERL3|nr:uncharacterized protein SERLADRAFT_477344 [Serpula lacrymans var. lacrymans S7.9]EGN95324.1 hypothetical protein SERLA73DRAFT_187624 [Serpula lacrymans var. lacrymans S7.3]EGO20859.1 hypothetical protein SERLADRAFT_477344 [Serpula lacrymans var. lacrymans S7.9]
MGSTLSDISSQNALTAAVVAGVLVFGYLSYSPKSPAAQPTAVTATPAGKGKKKKKQVALTKSPEHSDNMGKMQDKSSKNSLVVEPAVVATPASIPGEFTETGTVAEQPTPKSKKGKKKKSKGVRGESSAGKNVSSQPDHSDDASGTSTDLNSLPTSKQKRPSPPAAAPIPQLKSSPSFDTDSSWTRVESHPRPTKRSSQDASNQLGVSTEFASSDAGVTSSATGNSSPVTERTDDSASAIVDADAPGSTGVNRRTLAERLLPKPRKTGVADMLEEPDYPGVARIMRVQPRPGEKPATGFSWADYEDVHVDDGSAGLHDADGEDEAEWGVVKSKSRSKPNRAEATSVSSTQKAPDTMTKRQRQNANKREAEKAAKSEVESQRLATLAKHKRDLERERIMEQYSRKGGAKTLGGGMQATVDERGKLVWE